MSPLSYPPIVLATNNRHKVEEIAAILKRVGIRAKLFTLADFPKRRPVVENEKTIEGNAVKKAREVSRQTGHWALADDTGLFIKALKGKPGVFSARFAGPGCDYMDNNRKVLRLLKGLPLKNRRANFRSIAALALPSGKVFWVEGTIAGFISEEMVGRQGFGYDPVFYVPKFKKTFAEMGSVLKNRISHRAKAFNQVPKLLKRALQYS